jgi:hypothetical protein
MKIQGAILAALCLSIAGLQIVGCSKDEPSPPTSSGTNSNTNVNASDLAAPSLIAPPNGVQQIWSPINFSWNSVPNAACYEARSWYYGTTGTEYNFAFLGFACQNVTSWTYPGSLGTYSASNSWRGKTIYWHVRACLSQNNCGPWSTTYSFRLRDN